jgi:2-methylisocitrate lyase-like PEP mutase family enzyme
LDKEHFEDEVLGREYARMNGSAVRTELRRQLQRGFVLAPGIYNAAFAKLVEETGFECAYMTGFGTAARYGVADVGLITQTEMLANVRAICSATQLPVIADADTGYGNALNVTRTVRSWERAGAAALHIEDQVFPKKCGFMRGKQVIPLDEALAKLRAALDARGDGLVVIARTDTLAVNGWEDVVARTRAFADAGADLVFVDGIRTRDDLTTYANELVKAGLPCLYNGALDPKEVERLGFKVQILAGLALGAVHNSLTAAMPAWPREARGSPPHPAIALVYDGLTALIAQRAGFTACALPIEGAAALLGVEPDFVGIEDVAACVRHIADAVSIAVVAEAPRGMSDVREVAHCVRRLDAAGAEAVYLDSSDALQQELRKGLDRRVALRSEIIFAGDALAQSIAAVRLALERVRRGDNPRDQLKFDEITSLLGLDDVYALEARYASGSTKGQ